MWSSALRFCAAGDVEKLLGRHFAVQVGEHKRELLLGQQLLISPEVSVGERIGLIELDQRSNHGFQRDKLHLKSQLSEFGMIVDIQVVSPSRGPVLSIPALVDAPL